MAEMGDRVLVITGGMIVVLLLIVMLGINALMPKRIDSVIGGRWFERRYQSIAGHSDSFELWRREGRRVARVAFIVHSHRFYGDDCLAYSASTGGYERCFFACGEGKPFAVSPPSPARWSYGNDALLLQVPASSTSAGGLMRVTIEELKRRARGQRPPP